MRLHFGETFPLVSMVWLNGLQGGRNTRYPLRFNIYEITLTIGREAHRHHTQVKLDAINYWDSLAVCVSSRLSLWSIAKTINHLQICRRSINPIQPLIVGVFLSCLSG